MMKYRNANYNYRGGIDCEIDHPKHGWIPYTIDSHDTDETVDNAELLQAIGGDVAQYIPPSAEDTHAAWREMAYVQKEVFLVNALSLEILNESEAEQAITGWPSSWDFFFSEMSAARRIGIKTKWARAQNIYRKDPIISELRTHKSLSETEADALFKPLEQSE